VSDKPFSTRNFYLFLAGIVLFALSLACGYSGSSFAPQPSMSAPSAPEPTMSESLAPEPIMPAPSGPEPTEAVVEPVVIPMATESILPVSGNVVSPAINETRRLTLEYPPEIRLGDTDVVRLTLEVDNLGNVTPTAQIEGNFVTGDTVQIPNLYDTHNVIAEARFDIAGPLISPSDLISEPLLPGQSVTFYWSIRPQEAGNYRGTVWLSLRFVNKLNGEETQKALSAQQVQIEATTFLGLKADTARTAGGVGSIVAGILGFPFADDIFKFLWGRVKRGR
jgi:hypothetical protein